MSVIHREPELNWPDLRQTIELGKVEVVGKLLRDGTEEQRRSLAAELEAYVKGPPEQRWWSRPGPATAVAVAALGCLPSAARAAALLSRRNVRVWWGEIPVEELVEMSRARDLPWLGDLAQRLAGKLGREGDAAQWALVAGLLTETGTAPPTDDTFVRGWIGHLQAWHLGDERRPLIDRMRADPYLDALLPRLFEVDGLGVELARSTWDQHQRRWDHRPAMPATLTALAAEGRVDRAVLLDGVLGRFLRGDRVAALRAFVVLHDELAPTEAELTARVGRYVRLLPDAHSTVATLAQRALRRLDDNGRLELDTLLQGSRQLLARPEKMLVKAQLSWLDRVAKRERDRVGEVLETVAVAFGHDALDVQERALTIVLRHVARIEPPVRTRLAEAAAVLAGDLPGRAAAVLGEPAAVAVDVPAGWSLGPMPSVAPMPPPVTSAAELAEEIGALVHDQGSMIGWERVLAGLVACHADDPVLLREALAPILDRYAVHLRPGHTWWGHPRLRQLFGEVIRAALRTETRLSGWDRGVGMVRAALGGSPAELPATGYGPGPQQALALRVAEVAVYLRHRPIPMLVATPTRANGQLDATVLVERLAEAERAGWQPWRFDLEQALLRLPSEIDGDALSRAAVLRSPAGVRLSRWLTDGGAPHPGSVKVEQRRPTPRRFDHWELSQLPERRVVVGLRPGGVEYGPFAQEMFELDPTDRPEMKHSDPEYPLWPGVLPNHREVIAAWALPAFAGLADSDQRGAELLPLLAESAGPVGPAVALALAYTLAARHEADRVAGVDAFLALAGAGDLDGAALGRELGALAADGTIKLTRVVAGLAEAARAGARADVWAAIEAALPAVLAATPRGGPDLLALGAQTATTSRTEGAGGNTSAGATASRAASVGGTGREADRGALRAALAGIAARGGSGRLVTEARRLDRVLAG
ncbi:DUF6493 family protein [Micromonospora sp. NPDC049523]|uniref:DUF6493 family protein n=1 Tax=Micromonospora sp. NPDC049523 TaxID=3155921 RepID=UPI0034396362